MPLGTARRLAARKTSARITPEAARINAAINKIAPGTPPQVRERMIRAIRTGQLQGMIFRRPVLATRVRNLAIKGKPITRRQFP